jgi:hypothetical protein
MAAVMGAALAMPLSQTAFAQAGSVGGDIGKTDKSISGGNDAAPRRRAPPAPNHRSVGVTPPQPGITAQNLAGKWRWTAHCSVGVAYAGDLEIDASSANRFSGTLLDPLGGKIYDGSLDGTNIAFSREYLLGIQHWTGTLSRSTGAFQIRGALTDGAALCPFEATKE